VRYASVRAALDASIIAVSAFVFASLIALSSSDFSRADTTKIQPSPKSWPITSSMTANFADLYNAVPFQLSESGHSPTSPTTNIIDDNNKSFSEATSHQSASGVDKELEEETFKAYHIAAASNIIAAISICVFLVCVAARSFFRAAGP
jgi:hypothetical protein